MFMHVSVTHGVIISKERRALLVSYFMFLFWHHQFSTLAISRHYRRWLPQITLFIFGVIITRYFYSEYEFQQKLTATISHHQDLNFDENMGGIAWWAFGVNFFVTSSSSRKFTLECLLPEFLPNPVCLALLSFSSLSSSCCWLSYNFLKITGETTLRQKETKNARRSTS